MAGYFSFFVNLQTATQIAYIHFSLSVMDPQVQTVAVINSSDNEEEKDAIGAELLMKHPLQCKWALWYFKNDRAKSWNENLQLVATFEFVEDFWA